MPQKILVIDDEPMIQRMLSVMLQHLGYEVIQASGGRQALDILGQQQVDLVTCDLMMPEFSGMDFLRTVRADTNLANLPVVIITAAGSHTIDPIIQAGASAIIYKPFRKTELESMLTRVLKKSQG